MIAILFGAFRPSFQGLSLLVLGEGSSIHGSISSVVGTGNVISFCAAISACEKGHAWPMALNLLELQGVRFAKHEKHQVPFPFQI